MVFTKIPGLYTFQTLAHKSKFENHHPQRFLRNELQPLQPWGLFKLSGMFLKLSYSAWFSSSRLVSPPRALGLCMCQMRILWFHVKPSVRKAYIFKEYMYENKILFFYTLEIFSFGGVECRKSKYPLERLARRPPQLSNSYGCTELLAIVLMTSTKKFKRCWFVKTFKCCFNSSYKKVMMHSDVE